MRKCLYLFCLVFLCFAGAYSQQPAATPTTADDQVVKINTDLIQIDVTVIDKDGKIVTGLGPTDFELYENGQLQKISSFSFVSKLTGGATAGNGNSPIGQTAPSGSTRTPLRRADVRRTIAIVIDDLNLSFASVYYTRKALNRFIDEQMLPDDLVSVIRTGGGVGALQQFTSDKRVLKAAIAGLRWNPFSSIDPLTPVSQTESEVSERFTTESDQLFYGKTSTIIHPHDNIDEIQKQSRNGARNAATNAAAIFTQSALGTLKYIISGMTSMPGRKTMLLFSDGINIGETTNNKSRAPAVFDFLQSVADAANRSSVVVNTFDTRGMQSMSIAPSDNTYEVIDGHRQQKVKQRDRDFRDSQDGLVYFADQTGGKALLNSNDLNGGIQRVLDEQAGYYLLSYVPDADTFDAGKRRFNKFEVKVKRMGLKVSYRSGFFSTDPANEVKPQLTADRQIAESLMSPFSQSDIALNINALYANDPSDGAYIRSFLHIDAKGLQFDDTPDGWKKATFDVAAVTFGNNGVPGDFVQTSYTIKAKGPTLDTILSKGFVYVLMLPVKNAGTYQYRVALRDAATGKIGTASQVIDIPDLRKQQLTLSSIAVENVSVNTWQLINQGKVSGGTGNAQLRSTLLYDTVLGQFRPGTVLRYGLEVYNARQDGSKKFGLETQANILQNGNVVIKGTTNLFDSADASNVPRISSAIMLNEKMPAGEYVLEVIVRDTLSKQESKQLFVFQID